MQELSCLSQELSGDTQFVLVVLTRTAGSLFGFPATSVPSTLLQALRNLMNGAKFWFDQPSTPLKQPDRLVGHTIINSLLVCY